MRKSEIKSMPEYFDRYINLVANIELSRAFDESLERLDLLDRDVLGRLDGKKYAPDKWTAKEILQHIIDWERILSFRTMLIARQEGGTPQSIDENLLGANANAERRTIADLIDELKVARASTKWMFSSFDNKTLQLRGKNWNYEISVLAMGFAMLGHQIHHLKIIEEKYYPLAGYVGRSTSM